MAEVTVPNVGDTKRNPKTGEIATFTGEGWEISAAPTQEPAKLVAGEDVLRSGVGGLMHGGAQLLGLPFSVADLAAWGLGKATGAEGFDNIRRDVAPIIGSALEKKGNENIPGMAYKPTSTAGEWAHTAGEWAPSIIGAAFGGGVPTATKAIVSALGSEGMGQLAHHFTPAWETPARMIGALTGWRLPTTAHNVAERVTAPPATRIQQVNNEIAAIEAASRPGQFRPQRYHDLIRERDSHPAFTPTPPAEPGVAGALANWLEPAGYGVGGLLASHFAPGSEAALLASTLAGGSAAKLAASAAGQGTRGIANIAGQEIAQAPGVTGWMAGTRGIPYLDAQLQQDQP